ncbi:MAG: DEAD/DEAH box helicase [Nitrososphaerota archaeon]|jgi:ATP-dependent RNA helicase DeaD|uniref:DEAD/DEAH box helicase n=1 Tax=Candidatus Bathycorpusculum sp. TaxID=2994959 RepID=UPI00281D9A25|nr:DEAD/DEAH box helicase [Candidatus Termiticorpusculum sp.]MDR0460355.1 DEAD/DEAH box helicase [Nitrososphaerota archaeon]
MNDSVAGEKNSLQLPQSFKDLPISGEILKSLNEIGFDTLFPIQAQAIMPLLEGKDVIGQAQTGTGKTAAFGVPMIQRLETHVKGVQGLILAPTRELAVQVADNLSKFGKYAKIHVLPVYGGESINKQIHALNGSIDIVVGTPGRVIDLMKRRVLDLSSIRIVVLDEADRMLDMGFMEDVEYILYKTPRNRQTSLFSATIDAAVMRVCDKYMKNPEKILVSKDEIAVTQMKQYYIVINQHGKFETLCNILRQDSVEKAIVFCRTRRDASRVSDQMYKKGFRVQALHAGFTQAQRERAINDFKNGRLSLLVATDVAARGLDIQGITHIINYDVPNDPPVYFHRIGRTARKGTNGTAITLVSYGELSNFNNIKALTKTHIEELYSKNKNEQGNNDDSPIQSFY